MSDKYISKYFAHPKLTRSKLGYSGCIGTK